MTNLTQRINDQVVSRETADRLTVFAQLFLKWATKINLAAPSTLSDLWNRHVSDSAQIFQMRPNPATWVDLGSGGGFPGVITAIFLAELGQGWVHLIESNNKKAAFLRTAIAATGARATVHPVRVESAADLIPECDAISARALADLSTLLDYIQPWSLARQSPTAYFHKGRDYRPEVDNARRRWQFDLVIHSSKIEKDSVILEISGLRSL